MDQMECEAAGHMIPEAVSSQALSSCFSFFQYERSLSSAGSRNQLLSRFTQGVSLKTHKHLHVRIYLANTGELSEDGR